MCRNISGNTIQDNIDEGRTKLGCIGGAIANIANELTLNKTTVAVHPFTQNPVAQANAICENMSQIATAMGDSQAQQIHQLGFATNQGLMLQLMQQNDIAVSEQFVTGNQVDTNDAPGRVACCN